MNTTRHWGMGCINIAIAIACGAFGAHALKARVQSGTMPQAWLDVWHTAAQYHLWHGLAILVILLAMHTGMLRRHVTPLWGFWIGTALFSGSLYALVLSGVSGLGVITPLGGTVWILTWVYLGLMPWLPPAE
jgi:uncharacterized membrane protein YgdD (TMEM256/DUF423 family)